MLLRVEWPDLRDGTRAVSGYADLMAWPELGDLEVEEEILALLRGQPTWLGKRAFEMARLDAEARAQSRSLWEGIDEPPLSHYLAGSLQDLEGLDYASLRDREFSSIKVKWSQALSTAQGKQILERNSAFLRENDLRLRIDFNGTGRLNELLQLFSSLPREVIGRIDYLEDPFEAIDLPAWTQFQTQFPEVALYADRVNEDDTALLHLASGWVIKPALQPFESWRARAANEGKACTFTQYLGHAVGAAWAAWAAARSSAQVSGLLFHSQIEGESSFFSEALRAPTSRFPTALLRQGTGIGWSDAEFASISWSPWR